MSKRSRRVLEELSSASEDKLLLQATVDRQTYRRLRHEAKEIEESSTRKKNKPLTKKEKYFENLTNNQVTDISISIPGSHIDNLPKVQARSLYRKKNIPVYENKNITSLSNKFKKIANSGNLKVALNSCENFKPVTPVDHIINRIYLFVLRVHVKKP